MKKILINLIVVCLVFSLHIPFTNGQEIISNDSLEIIENKIVDELEQVGIQEVSVEVLSPMEAQTQHLEDELEEFYEEKIEDIIEKPLEEITNQKDEKVNENIEYLNIVVEETPELTVEDVQEFEELIYSIEDSKEDIEYINDIKDTLVFEDKEIKDKLINDNDIVVQIEGENESNEEFTIGLGFEVGDNVINVFSETDLEEYTEYEIILNTLTEDSLTADLVNLNTGEEVKIDLNEEEFITSAFWIPILGVMATASMLEVLAISVGVATLLSLAVKKQLSLQSGALWVSGNVANKNTKNKRYVHYEAKRTSNSVGLWVGPGKSKKKATSRLKKNLDTWSIGASNALSIAKAASPTGKYRKHSPHSASKGKRTFSHYHPHEYGSHAFYGGGKLW